MKKREFEDLVRNNRLRDSLMNHSRATVSSVALLAALLTHPTSASASWMFGGMASAMANSVQLGVTDNCIAPGSKPGDVIKMTENYVGIILSIAGASAICDDSSQVRAKVDVRLSEAARLAEHVICVARGLGKGDRFKDVGLGEMQIKQVTASGACAGDPTTPIQAVAVSTQAPLTTSSKAQDDRAPLAPAVVPKQQPESVPVQQGSSKAGPTPVSATAAIKEPGSESTSHKLRELATLLKDGLITQDDYDTKKRELLKAF
jgi:hypothetical protein